MRASSSASRAREHRETIASASLAAAAGGVTSIVMMPDTDPVIDNVALVEFILRTARDTALVNVYPAAAITKGLEGREMTEFGLLKEAGAVALTEGRHTIASPLVMRRALTYARDFGAVIAHETEDRDLAAGGVMNEGLYASWLGLAGIPREAETIPLERDLALARLTGGAYHAAKISTAASAAAIARAKADGARVTAGVSINNLSLNENDVGEYRTFFRLAPPLRAEDDRLAMIEALRDGTIDIIVSSHDPQDVDTKRLPFADAAAGAIGLETLLARRCGCITMATCRCCGWSRRCPARRQNCSDCPAERWRRAPAPTSSSSTSTSPGSCRKPASARAPRTPASRARGCRARSCKPWLRAAQYFRLGRPDVGRIDAAKSGRAGLRLSARLDPVRPADHARRRAWRRPQDRLRQYRRDQRAAHRQQGAGRADAAARCAEGHGRPC